MSLTQTETNRLLQAGYNYAILDELVSDVKDAKKWTEFRKLLRNPKKNLKSLVELIQTVRRQPVTGKRGKKRKGVKGPVSFRKRREAPESDVEVAEPVVDDLKHNTPGKQTESKEEKEEKEPPKQKQATKRKQATEEKESAQSKKKALDHARKLQQDEQRHQTELVKLQQQLARNQRIQESKEAHTAASFASLQNKLQTQERVHAHTVARIRQHHQSQMELNQQQQEERMRLQQQKLEGAAAKMQFDLEATTFKARLKEEARLRAQEETARQKEAELTLKKQIHEDKMEHSRKTELQRLLDKQTDRAVRTEEKQEDRAAKSKEHEASRTFSASQAELTRTSKKLEAEKARFENEKLLHHKLTAAAAQKEKEQTHRKEEKERDRAERAEESQRTRTFKAAQTKKSRKHAKKLQTQKLTSAAVDKVQAEHRQTQQKKEEREFKVQQTQQAQQHKADEDKKARHHSARLLQHKLTSRAGEDEKKRQHTEKLLHQKLESKAEETEKARAARAAEQQLKSAQQEQDAKAKADKEKHEKEEKQKKEKHEQLKSKVPRTKYEKYKLEKEQQHEIKAEGEARKMASQDESLNAFIDSFEEEIKQRHIPTKKTQGIKDVVGEVISGLGWGAIQGLTVGVINQYVQNRLDIPQANYVPDEFEVIKKSGPMDDFDPLPPQGAAPSTSGIPSLVPLPDDAMDDPTQIPLPGDEMDEKHIETKPGDPQPVPPARPPADPIAQHGHELEPPMAYPVRDDAAVARPEQEGDMHKFYGARQFVEDGAKGVETWIKEHPKISGGIGVGLLAPGMKGLASRIYNYTKAKPELKKATPTEQTSTITNPPNKRAKPNPATPDDPTPNQGLETADYIPEYSWKGEYSKLHDTNQRESLGYGTPGPVPHSGPEPPSVPDVKPGLPHDNSTATLRSRYGVLGPKDVIPSTERQLASDIQFDMFSFVQPGFGEGRDNKLFNYQNFTQDFVQDVGPDFYPRPDDGRLNYQHAMPWQWQSVQPVQSGVQMLVKETDLAPKIMQMARKYGEGAVPVLGYDKPEVSQSRSSQDLPRDRRSLYEPVIQNADPMHPILDPPGYVLQRRGMRRLFSPWREPQKRERQPLSTGPHLNKRRSLEVILP